MDFLSIRFLTHILHATLTLKSNIESLIFSRISFQPDPHEQPTRFYVSFVNFKQVQRRI